MAAVYQHSVSLDVEKCRGCTNCLKRCPTEAIRIRDGHAVINTDLCIDCGECIRVCQYKAKKAIFDKIEDVPLGKKYCIALPPPSLYGQFNNVDDVDYILQALLDSGFDQVFEVARAAEIVSDYTRNYMRKPGVQRPIINSACPTIVRLIRMRFPFLCDQVIPILPPIEIASRMAKEEARKNHPELSDDDICTVFISPCPAKASYVKNGLWHQQSCVDYVVSMSDMYFQLLPFLKSVSNPECSTQSGMIGLSWASTGGESSALLNDRYLAADGIENVICVLDEIDTGLYPNLEFVELNACNGGCVGGAAAMENPYIARVRLQSLRRYLPVSHNRVFTEKADEVPESFLYPEALTYRPVAPLDENLAQAMQMMQAIEELNGTLPALDCGSCGAPTCRAFAEDVVRGERTVDECIVHMRERLHQMLINLQEVPS